MGVREDGTSFDSQSFRTCCRQVYAVVTGKTRDFTTGAVAAYRVFLGDFLGTSEPDSGDH